MKTKLLILIGLLAFTVPAFAVDPPQDTTRVDSTAQFQIPDTILVKLGDETLLFIGTDAELLRKNIQAAVEAYNKKPAKTPGEVLLYILGLLTSGVLLSSFTQIVRVWKQLQSIWGKISRPKRVSMLISAVAAILWTGFTTGWPGFHFGDAVKLWGVAFLVTEVVYDFVLRYVFKKPEAVK